MNASDDCNSCDASYFMLVNECITPFFLNFTIYFGLIVSHVSIVIIIVILIVVNRRKAQQKKLAE